MARPRLLGLKSLSPEQRNVYERRMWRARVEREEREAEAALEGDIVKVCRGCDQAKARNETNFRPDKKSKDGWSYLCRACRKGSWGRMSAAQKKRMYDRHFIATHGYSREERAAALEQTKACEICSSRRHLHVDHCHKALRIRGVLCNLCNSAIGKFDDNPDILERAAAYLRKSGLHRSGDRAEVKLVRALRMLVGRAA